MPIRSPDPLGLVSAALGADLLARSAPARETAEAPDASALFDSGAARVCVDRGGTFTDLVAVALTATGRPGSDGRPGPPRLVIAKVPSDVAVIGRLAGDAPLTFGTTVATNALLERKGLPTLLIVSEGFEDLPLIRDMRRPDLFDPDARWPDTLATRVIGVRLDVSGVASFTADLDLAGVGAVAVAVTGTDDDARHEREIAERIRTAQPSLFVVCGHEVAPDPGYLARIETALVDAAITPHLLAHLREDLIPHDARAVRSDAGLVPAYSLRAPDAILSGPAAGVLAVLEVARRAGFAGAVGLDMGGTSTDVCLALVDEGPRQREGELEVAGVRLSRTMLEIDTIAAGGGSILTADGERLSVGPRSAGAHPGPQCYGRGGPPTLTDAALVAGLLDPRHFPIPLDPSRVALPVAEVSEGDPQTLERTAERFLDLAREAMAQAIGRLAMARGIGLRQTGLGLARSRKIALVAYGGAGGQHAAFVADKLGIDTVLVHPAAPVFCAFGQLLAQRSEIHREPIWAELRSLARREEDLEDERGEPDPLEAAAARVLAALMTRLGELPSSELEVRYELECVSSGTEGILRIPYLPGEPLSLLRERFGEEHRRRFGLGVGAPGGRVLHAEPEVRALVGHAIARSERDRAVFDALDVASLGLLPGEVRVGPAVIHGERTSIAVPAGWAARVEEGLLWVERAVSQPSSLPTPTPPSDGASSYEVALWQSRLMAIAEEGGAVLQRLARSVSIRERLDFSCALFDPEGRLVVNAPHIPVHLGAMGETVRDIAAHHPPHTTHDGDAWLTNDPMAGGSHLPDLTVVTAVHLGRLRFFCASRAHHVDVGGVSPGSMPTRSMTLAEEGIALRRAPLVIAGELGDVEGLVSGSRQPGVVVADLMAQLAANAHMARRLRGLGDPELVARRMKSLEAAASRATRRLLASLGDASAATAVLGQAHDLIDGVRLELVLRQLGDVLELDFSGCGPAHGGNLNAPRAVLRAAVLYALRLAIATEAQRRGEPLDHAPALNDGSLEPVRIVTRHPSIVDPPEGVAVVGGNVETSQRLVDLVLRALSLRAASAGSMSNLVIASVCDGGEGSSPWSFYETIGGGYGASREHDGASARQTHMTNTRATDPEILARRLPLRVVRFAIRHASGGTGLCRGGDGLVREIEALAPCQATLLAAWREGGAPGLEGGGAGAPGRAWVGRRRHSGDADGGLQWQPWDRELVRLEPGDRIRVETPGGGGWGRTAAHDLLGDSRSPLRAGLSQNSRF